MSSDYFNDDDLEEAKTADETRNPELVKEMAEIAEDHGFEKEKFNTSLIFKDWLYTTDTDEPSYDTNLALIKFIPGAFYLAVIRRPCYDVDTVVAFRMTPKFILGEPWRYEMDVRYVAETHDSKQIYFDSRYEMRQGELIFTIKPGLYEYEISYGDLKDIKLLRHELFFAISELCRLLGLRADRLDEELHKEGY